MRARPITALLLTSFALASCTSSKSEVITISNPSVPTDVTLTAPIEESPEVMVEIPEEFQSFFSSCSGIPSWEETNQEGRPVIIGYCEIKGEKFTSFTIDNPKQVNVETEQNSEDFSLNSTSETNKKTESSKSKQKNIDNKKEFSLITVPLWTLGHPFYLSPRNFPSVGQSFALESPINLESIGVHVNQRVTLLTAEGVELFRQDPTGMSLSKSKASEVEKAVFDPSYKFPATVEIFIYKHKEGPIPSNFDIFSPNFELVFNEKKQSTVKLESIYKSKVKGDLLLEAGYYLAVWKITNTPENVLTVFLSGRPEQLDGNNNAYPFGRTYSANSGYDHLFNEHPTKSGKKDSTGGDIWCRGDLQIFIEGSSVPGSKIKLERINDLPRGFPPNMKSCWAGTSRP
jgi:hypothetical protein